MEDNRKKLKDLIEYLTELYEMDNAQIRCVDHSIFASLTHDGEIDYANTAFENVVIVYDR